MKPPRFSLTAILLAVTVAAISFGGLIAWSKLAGFSADNLCGTLVCIPFTAPIWIPLAFAGFALGRKALTPKMVAVFAIAQAAGYGFAYLLQ